MDASDSSLVYRREAWFVPIAIVVAGLLLAVGVYFERTHKVEGSTQADITLIHPVSQADHIIGNPAAPVKLIEYADIDSSYSKSFQQTMEQIMSEYAAGGKVAWVYRHLPLIDQHVHAEDHAEAAECVASIGGPSSFWRFIDAVNAAAPGDLQFSPDNYDTVVTSLGILPQTFEGCLKDHTFQQKVADDFQNGLAIGAGGSPFIVLAVEGQAPITIDGSVPYDSLKKILDDAVARAAKGTQPSAQ